MLLPRHYRDLIALSAPIAGIQFAQIALTSTDLIMMGLIGVEALAAGGLATLLYNQFRTMCVGMVTGLGNLVAGAIGRSEKRTGSAIIDVTAQEEITDLLQSALFLATATALVAGGLLVILSDCLSILGQDAAVATLARPIMIALAPGLLPMVWLNVLRQLAVGMRRPGSLFWVTTASIAVNALLNAAFIYGWLGLPKLGLTGIGIATTLVQAWTLGVYLRTLQRDLILKDFLSLSFWKARRATVLEIARMGAPISLTYGLEASITSVASVVVGQFGPIELAASNIINQLGKIVYQLNVGLSHGSSIMVSRAVGQQEYNDIQAISYNAIVICFAPMAAIGIIYLLIPNLILSPFLGFNAEPRMYAAATGLIWFAVIIQFLSAWQNITIGLLRGLGNTKSGLTNTAVGYWLIGIPAIYVCSYWLGGGAGVWLGLCVAFGATGFLLWRRFTADLKRVLQPELVAVASEDPVVGTR